MMSFAFIRSEHDEFFHQYVTTYSTFTSVSVPSLFATIATHSYNMYMERYALQHNIYICIYRISYTALPSTMRANDEDEWKDIRGFFYTLALLSHKLEGLSVGCFFLPSHAREFIYCVITFFCERHHLRYLCASAFMTTLKLNITHARVRKLMMDDEGSPTEGRVCNREPKIPAWTLIRAARRV